MKFVISSRPCLAEDGKVMATARLGRHLELKTAYETLRSKFSEVKYSERLGIIKINYKGKTVMLFGDGKISIRRAENEADAIDAIRTVTEAL